MIKEAYKGRNVVERCFSRLKRFRAVATRFSKRAYNYPNGALPASISSGSDFPSDTP